MRVTAAAGTTIEAADPDAWNQVANLPNSVTWDPGTGGTIPLGDPTDSWIIDNDFLLSLGPVSSGLKTITIEWLAPSGLVLDAFEVRIPCALGGQEADFETVWENYTSTVSGGRCVFAYLEPDDCDAGDFDNRATCSISWSTPQPTCTTISGNNAYLVTFTGTPGYPSYGWSIDNGAEITTTANVWSIPLGPGDHSVSLRGFDSLGNEGTVCSTQLSLPRPLPDFSWQLDDCTSIATLDASIETENFNLVAHCAWTCSNLNVPIQPDNSSGNPAKADFSGFPEGWYDIILSVTDHYGCVWQEQHTLYVGGCQSAWEPNYSWCVEKIDPTVQADVIVTFTNTSRGCDPAWEWFFDDPHADGDDPNTSTDRSPTHRYKSVSHGSIFHVTLTLKVPNPSNPDPFNPPLCASTVMIPLTITQREFPKFTVKVCPDGKVICETTEPEPEWDTPGSPQPDIASWPYTKKDRSRIIYRFHPAGTYFVVLTSTNDFGNECQARKAFTVLYDCCAKNAHTKGISAPIYVQLSGNSETLRVKGKLRQVAAPLWHRVKAKTILQKLNSNNKWRRFKDPDVEVIASFGPTLYSPATSATVYMSEQGLLAFDGFHYTGCNCWIPESVGKEKTKLWVKKVRAVDGVGGRFRSKLNSIQSAHGVVIDDYPYLPLNLSLGEESDCGETWNWWTNWF